MKTLFFWLLLLFSLQAVLVQAQTSEGTLLIGGNVSGNFSRPERIYMADISPIIGVFVKDKLVIGGSVQLGVAWFGNKGRYTSLKILPMGRYYLGKSNESSIFLQADLGYHRVHSFVEDVAFTKSGLGSGGGLGAASFLNRMLSLEGLLKLSAFRYTDGSISLHPEFRLGFQFHLLSPERRH